MKRLILPLLIAFGLTSCQKEDLSPTYKGLVTPDTTGVAFPDSAANVALETYELWQADDCRCRYVISDPPIGYVNSITCTGDTTMIYLSGILQLGNGEWVSEWDLIDSDGYICSQYFYSGNGE